MVGRDIPLKILDISKWNINEIVAEYYSDGKIFCLGDAVHRQVFICVVASRANTSIRHPPFNGLGSNTCVQDAYNLAWKIKYVSHQLASPSILKSFSRERQPVGLGVVTRANQGIRDHTPVWDALGLTKPTVEERMEFFSTLRKSNNLGRERRKTLNAAVEHTSQEFHGIGVEMNHYYESCTIDLRDEVKAERTKPDWPENSTLYHLSTTFPGHRLPHAWLNLRMPLKSHVSTIDLAGHGVFCLLTGIGGAKWKEAAQSVGQDLDVVIRSYGIGWGEDYEDVYRDWEKKREVEEDGAVLVRPDRFICWRAMQVEVDCEKKLSEVMKTVLGR